MKRLYEKNELTFALLWIALYIIFMSLADSLSAQIGQDKLITAFIGLSLALFLIIWCKKAGLAEKFGLTLGTFDKRTYLFFLPLLLMISVNFWGGVCLRTRPLETLFYVISMLCVGVIEEVIFRGFLFKALQKDKLSVAIIVSSVTFGFGHIVNLLSGADVFLTLLQIVYATAAGFLFTVIFYRSGSLLPCIVTHSLINATSAFSAEADLTLSVITAVVLTVVSAGYALWIWKRGKREPSNE